MTTSSGARHAATRINLASRNLVRHLRDEIGPGSRIAAEADGARHY